VRFNQFASYMRIIEVKPCLGDWKVFEIPGVEPVFVGAESQRQAIDYAKTRQGFSKGESRVLSGAGEIVETIHFNDRRNGL
jgi:hypothetical protein